MMLSTDERTDRNTIYIKNSFAFVSLVINNMFKKPKTSKLKNVSSLNVIILHRRAILCL
jgi:hypothetical protein